MMNSKTYIYGHFSYISMFIYGIACFYNFKTMYEVIVCMYQRCAIFKGIVYIHVHVLIDGVLRCVDNISAI